MKYSYCLLAMLSLWVNAMQAQKVQALSIGDTVPDLSFNNIVNAPFSSASLSSFKDKVIILDFFSTGCGSCIQALPHLDSLQQQLKNKVQILVISNEPAATIRTFLQHNPIARNNKLPFVSGDLQLKNRFPHSLIPHEVWLKDGKVKAITLAEAVTEKNLQAIYTGKPIHAYLKRDLLDFNPSLSLLSQMTNRDTTLFMQQSLLTQHYDGLGTRRGTSHNGHTKRIFFINWNMLNLFQYAWRFDANRIVLDVKDPSLILDKLTDPPAWRKYNQYCYEATVPDSLPDSAVGDLLKTTLNTALPVMGSFEKRQLNCFVLTYSATNGKLPAANGPTQFRFSPEGDSLFFLHHTMDAFTASCNAASNPAPGKPIILNETGIPYPVDIYIPFNALKDITLLKEALSPYGLQLLPASRELTVFVLRDKSTALAN